MMKNKPKKFEVGAHLKSKEEICAYIDAVLEDGDTELMRAALADVARALREESK